MSGDGVRRSSHGVDVRGGGGGAAPSRRSGVGWAAPTQPTGRVAASAAPALPALLAALVLCALLPAAAFADGFFSQFKERLGLSSSGQPFLPVDEAFAFSAEAGAEGVVLRWRIADGYYLYRDRMSFGPADAPGFGSPQLPEAHTIKEDEFFGRMAVYTDDFEVVIPVARPDAGPVRIEATYQGCAEAGFCYPPESKSVELDLPPV